MTIAHQKGVGETEFILRRLDLPGFTLASMGISDLTNNFLLTVIGQMAATYTGQAQIRTRLPKLQ